MLQASIVAIGRKRRLPKPNSRKIAIQIPYEHDIQAAFIIWCHLNEKTIMPQLALGFAVPNGGKRSAKTAAMMKREGVRPGVPDWMLPVPRGEFAGLAIEFKRPGKRTTEEQRDYIDKLMAVGWLVAVCTCQLAAARTVIDYLKHGISNQLKGRTTHAVTVA
jgi:hypothetical protein